jgi:uncharacterized protein (UPF0335 family)
MTQPGDNQLKSIVSRIENLEEQKRAISDDIKDVYAEAKGNGLDPKQLRRAVVIRRQDPTKRAEADAILATYLAALGTPA